MDRSLPHTWSTDILDQILHDGDQLYPGLSKINKVEYLTIENITEEFGTWNRLGDVLDTLFHAKDCCGWLITIVNSVPSDICASMELNVFRSVVLVGITS